MQIGREKISGRNLDELSECSLAGESEKTRKITIPSPVLSFDSLVSVKENTDQKKEGKTKKDKNTDRTQTKLNVPHVMYNVKILPQ